MTNGCYNPANLNDPILNYSYICNHVLLSDYTVGKKINHILIQPRAENTAYTRGVLYLVQLASFLGNLRFHLNQSTILIKYSILLIMITANQRSFAVQICNMGLAGVLP